MITNASFTRGVPREGAFFPLVHILLLLKNFLFCYNITLREKLQMDYKEFPDAFYADSPNGDVLPYLHCHFRSLWVCLGVSLCVYALFMYGWMYMHTIYS